MFQFENRHGSQNPQVFYWDWVILLLASWGNELGKRDFCNGCPVTETRPSKRTYFSVFDKLDKDLTSFVLFF